MPVGDSNADPGSSVHHVMRSPTGGVSYAMAVFVITYTVYNKTD